MNMNVYIPSDCPLNCGLDQRTIGTMAAYVIAALYHPDRNKALARRQAEAIVKRPIAHTSWLRHLDHLRAGNQIRPNPADAITFENRREAIASLKESLAESITQNNGDPWGWDLAISAVAATGDDENWQQAYNDVIKGLGIADGADRQ